MDAVFARAQVSGPEAPAVSSTLRASGVVAGFGHRRVVDGVSVALRPGHVTAFVGPNGSGKSTLLRSLARLHTVEAGTIVLAGGAGELPIASLGPRTFAREVTLFTQSRAAPMGLSVRDVVAFGRHPYRRRFAGLDPADRAAIDHALAATGIADMADRAAGELSGGELQRVWLASCLAQQTGVVLLDEPTNHLDLRYQIDTLDLIRDLAAEHRAAVGVVLHDLDHAARVADDLVLLHGGTVVAAGSAAQVLTADNIERAYEIRVEVTRDERSGHFRIDPIGRHEPGLRAPQGPESLGI